MLGKVACDDMPKARILITEEHALVLWHVLDKIIAVAFHVG